MNAATKLPTDVGPIHFVGIGGIGMSGIAEVLLNHGYRVQGSDLKSTKITDRLVDLGATVFEGQQAANIEGAAVIVISSAIKPGNPELDAARVAGLPIVRRAEMLAELMRLKSNIAVAGTHGKTTTTTMVAELLVKGGIDPTVVNGGIIHAYGSNARMGQGEWMVVEADESDGTFNRLPATIAIVTNIDPEHMEHWGDFDTLRKGFLDFVSNIPFYGLAVCCIDHPEVQALVGKITDRRVMTYGFNTQADVRAINLHYKAGVAHFDIVFQAEGITIKDCSLPMPGDHNVSNAMAAVAVSRHLGMKAEEIRAALAGFGGVNRRFTKVGEVDGVTIIDDYGHHPVEITAVLKAARQATEGRVIAVHQPHRYSRLHHHFEEFCACFNDADVVGIAEVYAAGEDPIEGAGRDDLVAGLIRHGHRDARAVQSEEDLARLVREKAGPGDMVVCLGAGTISTWANALPDALAALKKEAV
ncbi:MULTISPECIES: UDP-N-acetylmuramate--L-alanine ligase [Sulfitobacter]|jgi:UDP-N-acetylmuramate--alanine ligase|uniref:UDP-N-acetylmuramate--L-alanine ligase n=2 Tax=root TaxID=1 RepID=A0A7V1BIG8_9RHOB|nr:MULTISPECIES: UDP-N-acetylmuramate--L-alanine ligase [Sulfitobacter]MBQ0767477.1 UDP-N-acetylmuramate--L-alanine ligase [Sulfitobacter litoralis]MCF7725468.1 UDP-N-acetylmuramate--L-alanine ligase [Sulfitobacter sp. M22]MCF7776854.1 UDP-N-acetylmuramate--L-alanine ligase [Sulfitobacter sp. M220]HDY94772.1 UDP-N-acetylmuramate--L-alanine ligase [Sulfitobacter litoralis]HDZ53826.1 UDP-N-acetylmuramate--L-alanine ligase [Sulfitobacter litoralis]|tara:strand:+ start:2468 stop:3883 length:1416 start_codon:yes stop_codon:yes gene_type:complete